MPKKSTDTKPKTAGSSERSGGAKSAATRARVLDAAAHVLATKGYAGCRLSDVATQAEVQAPAIYYYFASREDLIEEVMYVGIAHLREAVEASLAEVPDADPLTRILAGVAAHLRFELAESDYARAAVRNAQQAPEDVRARYTTEAQKYDKIWKSLFDAAGKAGVLRDGLDPAMARFLVLGMLNWTPEWWTPRRGSVAKVVEQTQDLVRAGIIAG